MPSTEDILKRIQTLETYIHDLTEGLPYADHGAYGQDRERIRIAENEKRKLIRQIDEARQA